MDETLTGHIFFEIAGHSKSSRSFYFVFGQNAGERDLDPCDFSMLPSSLGPGWWGWILTWPLAMPFPATYMTYMCIPALSSYCKPLNYSISSIHKAARLPALVFSGFQTSSLPSLKGPPSAAVPRCRGGAGETSTGRVAEAAGGPCHVFGPTGSRVFFSEKHQKEWMNGLFLNQKAPLWTIIYIVILGLFGFGSELDKLELNGMDLKPWIIPFSG